MELTYRLLVGDCRAQMATLPDSSVDAIVTDPPYELGFMGKSWDASGIAYDGEVWRQALRVLKPGGHLLAFSGSRTYHRMVVAIEDAGFEIRDQIMWLYGSGFPKSHDVSKAIDREAGAVREVVGSRKLTGTARIVGGQGGATSGRSDDAYIGATLRDELDITAPATPEAARWQGWGTALKPAHEPICVARKPLRGTVAQNVLAYGTGAINVDGCRVGTDDDCRRKPSMVGNTVAGFGKGAEMGGQGHDLGRWPANVIHDGSEEATAGLGDAARFFYSAKASKADRDEGMAAWEEGRHSAMGYERGLGDLGEGMFKDRNPMKRNIHPTVKPTDLMRYLVRLVTPPGGTVLDPFTGSGSTGKAAILEGFRFIGCELSPQYAAIAEARIANAAQRMGLPHDAPASMPQPVQVRDDGLQQLTLGLAIG